MLFLVLGMGTCHHGVNHLESQSSRNTRKYGPRERDEPKIEKRFGGQGSEMRENAMNEILMKCSPGNGSDRERFPNEIREERGMFEIRGDVVTK